MLADRDRPGPFATRWPAWFALVGLLAALSLGIVISAIGLALVGRSNVGSLDPVAVVVGGVGLDFAFLVVAFGFARTQGPVTIRSFGLRPTRAWRAIWMTAAGLLVFYAFAAFWGVVVGEQPEQETVQAFDVGRDQFAVVAAALVVVMLAPLVEELFFRGFVFGSLRSRFGFWTAALIGGVLFGAVHFTGADSLAILVPLGFLGFVFCALYEYTGSIYPPIAMHAINNAFALAATTDISPTVPLGGATLLIVCCAGVAYLQNHQSTPGDARS